MTFTDYVGSPEEIPAPVSARRHVGRAYGMAYRGGIYTVEDSLDDSAPVLFTGPHSEAVDYVWDNRGTFRVTNLALGTVSMYHNG